MKKYAIVLTAVLLLTGCSDSSKNKSENDNIVPVSNVDSSIDPSVCEITKKDYDNLDLSDVKVDFPDISEYHDLRLSSSSDMSIDERIEYIKKIVEKFCPEHTYSDDYLTWWGQVPGVYEFTENGIIEETYPNGRTKYPNVSKYKDTIAALNFDGGFLYESDAEVMHEHDAYLLLTPGTLVGTMKKSTGRNITEDINEDNSLAGWFPVGGYEKIERYDIDSLPDNSYKLYDKEVSLSEAAAYAVDFFDNDYMSVLPYSDIKPRISEIEVRRHNDTYGYRFLLKNYYEDIPFDSDFDSGHVSSISDGKNYQDFTNEAFMVKSNDIDFWYMQQPYSKVEYDGDAVANIVPLDEALSIMSDKLTKSVVFEVKKVEFVYCPLAFEKDSSETTAEAAWKIFAYNPNDNNTYIVYVNATDGKLRYCVKNI